MAIPIIEPGALTARLVLERPEHAGDGQGGAVTTYAAIATLWVRIEPVATEVEERAGARLFAISHRIWLRYRPDLRAGMRFVKGARAFTIRAFRDPDESGRFLVCDCEEEGA